MLRRRLGACGLGMTEPCGLSPPHVYISTCTLRLRNKLEIDVPGRMREATLSVAFTKNTPKLRSSLPIAVRSDGGHGTVHAPCPFGAAVSEQVIGQNAIKDRGGPFSNNSQAVGTGDEGIGFQAAKGKMLPPFIEGDRIGVGCARQSSSGHCT
jgi:hypothetical protein